MDPQPEISHPVRHKCSACYRQFKKKEHLIEHVKESYHSVHEPQCGVCKKRCKTFESVREHLLGPLAKSRCATIFASTGCNICLTICDSPDALKVHGASCRFVPATAPWMVQSLQEFMEIPLEQTQGAMSAAKDDNSGRKLVSLDCEMVGGGSCGSLDICARVCLIDEDENINFHSYVKPIIPITDYRYDITGITEDNLVDSLPLAQAREKILEILYNGEESTWTARSSGGKACLLIGHDLDHDLSCLQMDYPKLLIRDTAKYIPLLRTNLVKHSLKYLTRTYLGYEIQSGIHNPYEDCVAALRLYKRMRSQFHQTGGNRMETDGYDCFGTNKRNAFKSVRLNDLLMKSPDALLELSSSKYTCWCLDSRRMNS